MKRFLLLALLAQPALALDIHVNPTGDDKNPGSNEKPIASLHKAQELLRSSDKRGKEPISIVLSKGIHYLGKPLILEAADSGSKDAPVTFTAAKGETAVISGGTDLGKSRLETLPRRHHDGCRSRRHSNRHPLCQRRDHAHGSLPELRS